MPGKGLRDPADPKAPKGCDCIDEGEKWESLEQKEDEKDKDEKDKDEKDKDEKDKDDSEEKEERKESFEEVQFKSTKTKEKGFIFCYNTRSSYCGESAFSNLSDLHCCSTEHFS